METCDSCGYAYPDHELHYCRGCGCQLCGKYWKEDFKCIPVGQGKRVYVVLRPGTTNNYVDKHSPGNMEVFVWKPRDWASGYIEAVLK